MSSRNATNQNHSIISVIELKEHHIPVNHELSSNFRVSLENEVSSGLNSQETPNNTSLSSSFHHNQLEQWKRKTRNEEVMEYVIQNCSRNIPPSSLTSSSGYYESYYTSTNSTLTDDTIYQRTLSRSPIVVGCQSFGLSLRQLRRISVVCGFLIVIGSLALGIAIPIAFQIIHSIQQPKNEEHGVSINQETSSTDIDLVGNTQNLTKLLSESLLIDGHNDLAWNLRTLLQNQLKDFHFNSDLRNSSDLFSKSPWSQTDLVRLRSGKVGAQLWSAYVPCSAPSADSVQIVLEQIDVIIRLIEKYKTYLRFAKSVADLEKAFTEKRIGSLIGIEGGHSIGNSLAVLRMVYSLGARFMTLTHNCNTLWAQSSSDDSLTEQSVFSHQRKLGSFTGLTEFGKIVILEMNRIGMIVDLAHASVETMRDALQVSKAPVIFSHSGSLALCNNSRNVPDEILKLLKLNGGLIMMTFYNYFLTCNETASVDDIIAHLNYIKDLIGVSHVGIGSGFDGINLVPIGLEDTASFPNLINSLIEDYKWTQTEIEALMSKNFLRVFKNVETIRDSWKTNLVGPIEEIIPRTYELNTISRNALCDYNIFKQLKP